MPLHQYLKRVVEQHETLSRADARSLLDRILGGHTSAEVPGSPQSLQLAALLGGISARGETSAELVGMVEAMRSAATPVPLHEAERSLLVDTCGTGGDASGTFNISTAAALVAAAVESPGRPGIMVAKHGNRAVTSACGSADVLEALGIPVTLSPDEAAAALRKNRFAFLHAPSLHPAMKAVMPVRRALGIRTIFNVLGPLTNPAGARAQVMGVYAAHLVSTVADAMRLLGVRHAFVVHGSTHPSGFDTAPGMDELSISGPSHLAEIHNQAVTFFQLSPEQVGLKSAPMETLRGADACANAGILRAIFAGELGPRRDIVLLNAAAVLIVAGLVPEPDSDRLDTFRTGITMAAHAIDSGAVTALVATLARTEP
jgi:anthranilate phosphoribosyltransferase